MVDFTKKILNSDKFRTPALTFLRTGVYCSYPLGSTDYFNYWDQQVEYCLKGYTAPDGDYITGYHYFYLNFCPIVRIVNRVEDGKNVMDSDLTFPDFYDYDYFYFTGVQEAETQGKHIALIKSRRKGYSYKGGSMACRNYYLIPGAKTYIYASSKQYLTEDGILTKAWEYMDFIDKYTAWGKKRQVSSTSMRRRASYIVTDEFGNKREEGYKSEIIGVSLKDNPHALRGKRAKLILFEEGGTFSELGAAWQIARPSVEQDGKTFGLMVVWGTGGDEGSAFETLKDMFYNPSGYNCLGFENIWDESPSDKLCGFFVPQYTNLDTRDEHGNRLYMDEYGNTILKPSLQFILDERKKVVDSATSTTAVDRYIAERPVTPLEAMMEFNGNIFPKKDLMHHLAMIRTNKKLQNHKQVGDLNWVNGIPVWVPKKHGDVVKFPLKKDDDPTGAIVIWEHPVKDAPFGLYVAGCLTPGEKVMTDKGLVNVEDVDHNHKLINAEGLPVKIKVFQRRLKDNEATFKLKPTGSFRTTTFTKEHPILLKDKGFTKASELNVGDWLDIPNRYLGQTDDYKNVISNYISDNIADSQLLWWFFGIWLGDGFNNKNQNSHDIYVSFGKNQTIQAEQYSRVIESVFNRKPLLCKSNGHNTRRFTHKDLYNLLDTEFNKYSYGKRIPEWVKTAPDELRRMFLIGYLDSDGSAFYDRSLLRVSFTSVNLELLESVQDILYGLKIRSSITIHNKECTSRFNNKDYLSRQSYKLNILSCDLSLFKFELPKDIISDKLNRINEYKSKINSRKQKIIFSNTYDRIFIQIERIDADKYTGTVYNFECDTHTYMCRTIVTHNCDPLTTNLAVRLIVVRIEQNRWKSLVDNTEVNN